MPWKVARADDDGVRPDLLEVVYGLDGIPVADGLKAEGPEVEAGDIGDTVTLDYQQGLHSVPLLKTV